MAAESKQLTYLYGVTVDISLQFLAGIVDDLAQAGHNVHVVSAPGPRLHLFKNIPGVTVHELMMKRNPHPLWDITSLLQWVLLLWRVRPDVTVVGTPKAGLLGSLAAKVARVPRRVYVLHGLRLETASGVLRRLLTLFEKLIFRCSTDVIAVSKTLRARAVELGIDPHQRSVVLGEGSPNGIDLESFNPSLVGAGSLEAQRAEWGLEEGVLTIGFVGRLVYDKGVVELATAVKGLLEDGLDVQLLVVGDRDETSPAGIADCFARLGNRVKFTGWLDDTKPAYLLFDVLCLPSYREGLSTSVLEAGAMGVAVVGTDVTGIRDIITSGENGVLVPKQSVSELQEALRVVLTDERLRSRLGSSLHKTVKRNFNREIVVRSHIDYLRQQTDKCL